MSDEWSPRNSASAAVVDDTGFTAVLAHSMLGTASAIGSAIALALASEPGAKGRDSLLALAMNRLEFLTSQLRDLAAGTPVSLVPAVDLAQRQGDPIVEDGTPVELYSGFEGTWSAGFEIASAAEIGYRIRRISDGSLLPGYTSRSDLRMLEDHESR